MLCNVLCVFLCLVLSALCAVCVVCVLCLARFVWVCKVFFPCNLAHFESRASALAPTKSGKEVQVKSRLRRAPRLADLACLPWNRWTDRGALVFADDLTVKPRTKLNNQGAHAMGVKFNVCAEKVPPVLPPTNGSL